MDVKTTVSEFGVRLKHDRNTAGLTVRQLADAASINYSYITKIETGRPAAGVSVHIVRALAAALQAEELEYIYLSGLLPEPLNDLLATPESRQFIRAALGEKISAQDWSAVTRCLDRRAKKALSYQPIHSKHPKRRSVA